MIDVVDFDGSVIDIMVFYTPAARRHEGGTAEIEASIDLWVAETNQAYAASGVIQRLNLVRQEEIAYIGTGESEVDLSRFAGASDGHMDEIHALRDAYAADIMHLVVEVKDSCGQAYQMLNAEPWEDGIAFAMTGAGCGALVFAHELGPQHGDPARPIHVVGREQPLSL